MLYQNYLRVFWSTVVSYDPFPSTDETEQRPLKEFLITFSILNGQRPLTPDFNTFYSSTGLDYKNGKYVAHPTPEVVKKELGKISINPSYLDKTPVLKNSFLVSWRILFTFVIQVLSGNYSSTEQGTRKSQPLLEGTTTDPKDSGGNDQPADKGLPSTVSNEGTAKTTPCPEGPLGDKDSRGNKPPVDMEPIHPLFLILQPLYEGEPDAQPLVLSTYADVRAFLLSNDEAQESEEAILDDGDEMDEDSQTAALQHHDDLLKKYDNILLLIKRQLVKYLRKVSSVLFNKITEDHWEKHEEAAVYYANLKASIDDYYDENIAHKDQTDKLVSKSNTTTIDLYKGLQIVIELLKEIKNAVKDDPAMNNKINESTKTFTKISTNITEAHALKQDEELATWAKSSTNMAWNLGQSFLAPSDSVTSTLALTHILANVEGENETNTATKAPPSYIEGETVANKQEKSKEPKHSTYANIEFIGSFTPHPSITQAQPITIIHLEPIIPQREGKGIATEEQAEDQRKRVKASSIVRPDPVVLVLILYTINAKLFHLTAEQIHAHLDKEEQIKKGEEEARLLAINKPKQQTKTRENHDIKIHPKTKPVVITVYRGTDGRNFDVHNPFAFGEFGISELDELREIIPRKKNIVVKDLMNSLSRRYERIKKIPKELGIPSALPAPIPEQAFF
ncbi:hypothetical protein Tco_0650790 [Tanacetum coccineum]